MRAFAIYSLGLAISLAIGSSLTLSCSDSNRQSVAQTGTASVRLTAVGVSGAQYRLRNGSFNITGTSSKTIRSEEHLTDTSIDVQLRAGPYSITLASGWFLERAKTDGTFERLEATLLSSNPQSFEIVAQKTTNVRFRFRVAGEIIDLGGTLSIGIDIEEPDGGHADAGPDASIDGGPEADSGADAGSMLRFRSISAAAAAPCANFDHGSSGCWGENYTCGVLTDGTVRCWGANFTGQLGNGTEENSLVPLSPTGLKDVISVDAYSHTCALLTDHTAQCWGSDGFTASLFPSAAPNVSGVVSVEGGYKHTCALKADGSVLCWGANEEGQLGNGLFNDSPRTPVSVMNLSGVVSISAGGTHTCALLADGTMRCWGGNYSGQLGNGEQVYSRKPVAVSGLGGVVSISAGGSHTCAVLSDGTARCWGENRTGQLGNAGSDRSLLPVSVSDLSGVASISAGELHTCAVLTNGGAACWGKNSRGQLGNGTTKNSSLPVPVSSLSGVASISAGYKHTCAVLTDGTARCWGANGVGQLGNWTVKNSSIPVAVHLTSCGNGVVDPREECDPPDRDSDCDWSCHSSPQFCGNAIIDQGEECDDGNSTWGDTCFQCSARKYFILNKPYMGHVSILRVDKRGISEAIVPASGALDGLSALAVEPDGSVLYALEATSSIPAGDASPPAQNRLLYLDPATGTIRDQLAFDQTTLGYAARPTAITLGNDGFLYVSADLNPGSRLLRIDPRNKVVTEVMTLSHTSQITTDNSGFLYSTGHLSVYQISLATHSISDFAQGRWSPDGFRSWQGLTFDAVTNEVWAVDVIEYYADLWSFDASSGAGTMHGTVDVYLDNTIPTLLIDTDGDPLLPRQRSNEILKMFELANPRGVGPYARAWDRNIKFPIDIEMVDFSAR